MKYNVLLGFSLFYSHFLPLGTIFTFFYWRRCLFDCALILSTKPDLFGKREYIQTQFSLLTHLLKTIFKQKVQNFFFKVNKNVVNNNLSFPKIIFADYSLYRSSILESHLLPWNYK